MDRRAIERFIASFIRVETLTDPSSEHCSLVASILNALQLDQHGRPISNVDLATPLTNASQCVTSSTPTLSPVALEHLQNLGHRLQHCQLDQYDSIDEYLVAPSYSTALPWPFLKRSNLINYMSVLASLSTASLPTPLTLQTRSHSLSDMELIMLLARAPQVLLAVDGRYATESEISQIDFVLQHLLRIGSRIRQLAVCSLTSMLLGDVIPEHLGASSTVLQSPWPALPLMPSTIERELIEARLDIAQVIDEAIKEPNYAEIEKLIFELSDDDQAQKQIFNGRARVEWIAELIVEMTTSTTLGMLLDRSIGRSVGWLVQRYAH
jgi:hypothetical protein